MGDTSDSSSPDDILRDPTFRCKVKIDPPKVIRKSSRFIKSIADLGKGSLFTLESKDNQLNTKTKKRSKAVPSQIEKNLVIKCLLNVRMSGRESVVPLEDAFAFVRMKKRVTAMRNVCVWIGGWEAILVQAPFLHC